VSYRLATIIDYDTILVLDQGTIAERGHPALLLREHGALSALVDQAGSSMAAHLRGVAEAAFAEAEGQRGGA
jgi:ABC-type transport system involved in cytochrome bd biosynthesis fused ATPase/permease subunit